MENEHDSRTQTHQEPAEVVLEAPGLHDRGDQVADPAEGVLGEARYTVTDLWGKPQFVLLMDHVEESLRWFEVDSRGRIGGTDLVLTHRVD
jgi:hypothetical protein